MTEPSSREAQSGMIRTLHETNQLLSSRLTELEQLVRSLASQKENTGGKTVGELR